MSFKQLKKTRTLSAKGKKVPFRFGLKGLKKFRFKNLTRAAKFLNPIKRDPFGNILFFKRMLIGLLAATTYSRLNLLNKLKVEGTEHLKDLPSTNVMFISNHQTYYADVMAFYHIFCSVKWKFKNTINFPIYMLAPRAKIFYIAAEETMKKSGLLPKVFSYTGAITVKRSWRSGGKEIKGAADVKAPDKIKKALDYGWVVNFPQGTTTPFAPVRKGTAHMIKAYNPIVIPVVIDGFRRAFDKKGLAYKKLRSKLRVRFKEPMVYSPDDSIEEIMEKIRIAIEQEQPNAPQTQDNQQI